MKKTMKISALVTLIVLAGYLAQAQPLPGSQSGGPIVGGPIGGGAPIGGGLCILLAMGLAYGASKLLQQNDKDSVSD